jgi:hypothetical protein
MTRTKLRIQSYWTTSTATASKHGGFNSDELQAYRPRHGSSSDRGRPRRLQKQSESSPVGFQVASLLSTFAPLPDFHKDADTQGDDRAMVVYYTVYIMVTGAALDSIICIDDYFHPRVGTVLSTVDPSFRADACSAR